MIIPFKGTITYGLGVAPFQFSGANPHLGSPVFNTMTMNDGFANNVPGDFSGGFFGLKAYYTSITPLAGTWGNNSPPFGYPPVQMAGAVVGAFGVFDFDMTLENPSQYVPVATSPYEGYNINFCSLSYIGGMYMPIARANTLVSPGEPLNLGLYRIPFPSLLYENVKVSFTYVDKGPSTMSVSSGNFDIYNENGVPLVDELTRAEVPFIYTCGGVSDITGMYQGLYLGRTAVNSTIVKNQRANYVLSLGYGALANTSGVVVNPSNGNAICITGTGVFNGSVYQFPTSGAAPPYFYTTNIFVDASALSPTAFMNPTVLSDPDDAASFGTVDDQAQYHCVMTPFGHFLMFVPGYPYWFLILSDFSGYYRITFNPNSSAAAAVAANPMQSGGFGMDLTGNIWIMGTPQFVPILYSTFKLGAKLTLNPFPVIGTRGVLCQPGSNLCQNEWDS